MKTIEAFLVALQMLESGGDYRIVNSLNYLGAYQFGEAALTDLGYVRFDGDALDNDYSGGWTGKSNIHSVSDFLNSQRAQDQAAHDWLELMWHYIEEKDLDVYSWQEVNGVLLTPSGMLAAAHLLGPDALGDFIATDGRADLRDPYGTPIVSYIIKLAGYDIPFAPDASTS